MSTAFRQSRLDIGYLRGCHAVSDGPAAEVRSSDDIILCYIVSGKIVLALICQLTSVR